jgi:hypothetical protein
MALTQEEKDKILSDIREGKTLFGTGELSKKIPASTAEQVPSKPKTSFSDIFVEQLPEYLALGGATLFSLSPFSKVAPFATPMIREGIKRGAGEIISAATGAMAGEYARQRIKEPDISFKDSIKKQVLEGAESAVIDAAGNVVFSTGGKVFKILKDKFSKIGVDTSKLENQFEIKKEVQQLLQQEGASLQRYQVTGSALDAALESIARLGFTGKARMRSSDEKIADALQKKTNDYLKEIVTKDASDYDFGTFFKETIKKGKEDLNRIVSPFYENLEKKSQGVMVDFSNLIKNAEVNLEKKSRVFTKGKGANIGDSEVSIYEQLASYKNKQLFYDAHKIKSDLLLQQRILEGKGELPKDSDAYRVITQAVNFIDSAMDDAVKKVSGGDKNLYNQYRKVSDKYREGFKSLYGDALVNQLVKNPEKVGEGLVKSGNVSEILQSIKALEEAKNLAYRARGVPFPEREEIMQSLRKGFLQETVGLQGNKVTFNTFLDLEKKLDDRKFKRTFDILFAKDQKTKQNLKKLINISKIASVNPENSFSLLVAAKQANAAQSLVTNASALALLGTGATSLAGGIAGAISAAGVLITPKFLAKIVTNPEAINTFLKIEQQYKKQKFWNPQLDALFLDLLFQSGASAQDYIESEEKTIIEQQEKQVSDTDKQSILDLIEPLEE